MGELVVHDVLRVVRVAGVAEQVFLSATDDRIRAGGPEAARAAIPKLSGGHSTVLGHLRGELIVRHDDQATVAFDHVVDNILAVPDHLVDEIGGLLEREIGNLVRRNKREAVHIRALFVECR